MYCYLDFCDDNHSDKRETVTAMHRLLEKPAEHNIHKSLIQMNIKTYLYPKIDTNE